MVLPDSNEDVTDISL